MTENNKSVETNAPKLSNVCPACGLNGGYHAITCVYSAFNVTKTSDPTAVTPPIDPVTHSAELGAKLGKVADVPQGPVLGYNVIAATDEAIAFCAMLCHQVNLAYSHSLGELAPAWNNAPQWQKDSAIAGVHFVLDHVRDITPEMSHESWMAQKLTDGWKYGDYKDPIAKTHPCIKSYVLLPLAQRTKDALFIGVVKAFFGWD